jgi:DNA-binding NarL/FixJ family response regulator
MRKVLVVEDNESFRIMLTGALSEELEGLADVLEAPDGQQALNICRETRPEIVLMDIDIPGPHGIMAMGIIKAENPACKVIIVTNHDSWEYRDAAQNAGADHFFSKRTSTLKDIIFLVKELLTGKRTRT